MRNEITRCITNLDCERDVDFGTDPKPENVLAKLAALEDK